MHLVSYIYSLFIKYGICPGMGADLIFHFTCVCWLFLCGEKECRTVITMYWIQEIYVSFFPGPKNQNSFTHTHISSGLTQFNSIQFIYIASEYMTRRSTHGPLSRMFRTPFLKLPTIPWQPRSRKVWTTVSLRFCCFRGGSYNGGICNKLLACFCYSSWRRVIKEKKMGNSCSSESIN